MQTNQTTRELYRSYENVLVSLGYQSPVDIAQHSFATFRQACRSVLSWGETRSIYLQAQQHVAGLAAQRRKILTHANPQLKNALHLAINPMQQQTRDYETLFGQRADAHVPTSSVASMFSPAGYLTELYREGKQLHTSDKPQHLDKRRPDLQSLLLSQSNQDAELTTLALSNDILLSTIQTNTQETDTQVSQSLNNIAYPLDLPYHISFASIETALAVQNTRFEALAHALAPSQTVDSFPVTTRSAYANHLPPGLCDLLLAPIPSDVALQNNMLLYHLGTSDIEQLSDVAFLCQRLGISRDELNEYLSIPVFERALSTLNDGDASTGKPALPGEYGAQYFNVASQTGTPDTEGMGTTFLLQQGLLKATSFSCKAWASPNYVVGFIVEPKLAGEETLTFSTATKRNGGGKSRFEWDGSVVGFGSEREGAYEHVDIPLSGNFDAATIFRVYREGTWSVSVEITFETPTLMKPAFFIKLSQLVRYSQKTGLSPAALDSLIALSSGSTPPAITNDTLLLTARALEYQQRYALSEDDALVLAGANINAYAPAGELSQFDQLFNSPPLNDVAFTTSDGNDTISFAPTDTTYTQERAVLKRALGVDDAGLATLAAIVDHEDKAWARSLTHLSTLYRVGLWARVHGLAPQELQLLLQLNGKTAELLDTTYVIYSDYLDAVYNTSEWLVAQQLSVAELNVMTTQAYPDTMTPEIDSFVRTLYQVVKEGEVGGRLKWPECPLPPPSQAKTWWPRCC